MKNKNYFSFENIEQLVQLHKESCIWLQLINFKLKKNFPNVSINQNTICCGICVEVVR